MICNIHLYAHYRKDHMNEEQFSLLVYYFPCYTSGTCFCFLSRMHCLLYKLDIATFQISNGEHYSLRMFTGRSVIVFTLLAFQALAEDAPDPSTSPPLEKSDKSEYKKSLSRDCGNVYTATCLKLDIVSWVDKLNEDDDYNVMPGVSLVRENGSARSSTADIVAELARDFPNDADARLDAFLMKKVTSYLNSHSVRLDLFDKKTLFQARGRGGGGGGGGGGGKGGGGGGGGGGMGMMMAAGAMMKGTLVALALGG